MDKKEFIGHFESLFENADYNFELSTPFKTLPEWNSMHALYLVGMIDAEYNVEFTHSDLKNCTTVEDVFKIVESRHA